LEAEEKCSGCLELGLSGFHVKCVSDKIVGKPVVKLQSSPRSAVVIGKAGDIVIDPSCQVVTDFTVVEWSKPQFVVHLRGRVAEVGELGAASSSGNLLRPIAIADVSGHYIRIKVHGRQAQDANLRVGAEVGAFLC
jgi:hypothetical protein